MARQTLPRPSHILRMGDGVPVRIVFADRLKLWQRFRIYREVRANNRHRQVWIVAGKTMCVVSMDETAYSLLTDLKRRLIPVLGLNAVACITTQANGMTVRLDVTPHIKTGTQAVPLANTLLEILNKSMTSEQLGSALSVSDHQIELAVTKSLHPCTNNDAYISPAQLMEALRRVVAPLGIWIDYITTLL